MPPSVSTANGSSSTFHRPNEKNTGAKTISVERRIGVRTSMPTPDFRLATTALTLVSSSTSIGAIFTNETHAAEKRNVSASMQKAIAISPVEARNPAPANPIAVEPNELIDRNEFAAASSSSVATSGIRLSWAGSKNCFTPLARSRTT